MDKKETFYITTPIYYTNGVPHIGHAYSSIIADVIARYNKISGKRVKFLTGVDENSQKALIEAQKNNLDIREYLDMMSEKHKVIWDGLDIKYTDFIRTTEERHHKFVREVLQKSYDKGDIYQGVYEGKYCIGCESFKKDDELILKDQKLICPLHLTEPEYIKEKNYFFKLSKYQHFLEDFYKNNPDFVLPKERFNEVISFVKSGLEDFSVSRETNKFGIKLPFDETQVTYVWYDALFNYITVCKYPDNGGSDMDFWPANLHVVGKDILRFHAIFWPAMLESAGFELPKNILTTGFFTIDGQKISKSLGNVIDPVEFSNDYSKDLLTLYLLSTFNIGQDGDFDKKQAVLMYNAKLCNNLGNLVNRVVVLTLKLENSTLFLKDYHLFDSKKIYSDITKNYNTYNLKNILDEVFKFLDILNKYTDTKEPWKIIKDKSKKDEINEVLYNIAEGLRVVGLILYPFFPEKMSVLFNKLGLNSYEKELENGNLNSLINKKEDFLIKEKGEALFSRFD